MKIIIQAALLMAMLTLVAGIIYPVFVTGIGQTIWPKQSNGSIIHLDKRIVGSELLAQQFKNSNYFWSRPSASGYNAVPSSASNLGPTSAKLAHRREKLRQIIAIENHSNVDEVPEDLITTSASGLDPHISLAAAQMQIKRITKNRNLQAREREELKRLLQNQAKNDRWRIFAEERVNVLLLNIALDKCCKRM